MSNSWASARVWAAGGVGVAGSSVFRLGGQDSDMAQGRGAQKPSTASSLAASGSAFTRGRVDRSTGRATSRSAPLSMSYSAKAWAPSAPVRGPSQPKGISRRKVRPTRGDLPVAGWAPVAKASAARLAASTSSVRFSAGGGSTTAVTGGVIATGGGGAGASGRRSTA